MQLELIDISFKDYQKFLVNGDVSVCGGEENAARLYQHYLEVTKSDLTIRANIVVNNIEYYKGRIELIDLFLVTIQQDYSADIAEILRTELGFDYEFSEESYMNDVKMVTVEGTMYKTKLQEWLDEYEKINDVKGEKPTFEYYALLLESMSSVLGRNISDDISVIRFAAAYRMYLEKIKTPPKGDGAR